jgi:competence protein ComEA
VWSSFIDVQSVTTHFELQRCLAVLIAATLIGVWGGIATTAPAQTNSPSQTRSSSAKKGGRVNINSADLQSLESLPGINATLAKRIVAGRPYKNIDDLKKVKGLTQTKIDGLKNHVTFGTATASTKKSKSNENSAPASTEETSSAATARNENMQSSALPATGHTSGTAKKTGPAEPININIASQEELETLPGIGPTKAQAIVDYRQQNGDFASIEDIQKVKGIKQGEFSKIKDMIKVSR